MNDWQVFVFFFVFGFICHNSQKNASLLPSGCLQCYQTANFMFDAYEGHPTEIYQDMPVSVPCCYVVEIEITDPSLGETSRKEAGIVNTFYFPRLFCHAFNIESDGTTVRIYQSWFKVMEYQLVHVFDCWEFGGWWATLRFAIENFAKDPMNLFFLFNCPLEDGDLQSLINFVSNSKVDPVVRAELKCKLRNKLE